MSLLDGVKLIRLKKQASDLGKQMEQIAISETEVNANTVNAICKMGFELDAIQAKIKVIEDKLK